MVRTSAPSRVCRGEVQRVVAEAGHRPRVDAAGAVGGLPSGRAAEQALYGGRRDGGEQAHDAFMDAAAILWPTRCKRRRSVQNRTVRGPAPDTRSRPCG